MRIMRRDFVATNLEFVVYIQRLKNFFLTYLMAV